MFWKHIKDLVPLFFLMTAGGCMNVPEPSLCSSTGIICPPGMFCSGDQKTCISGSCGNSTIDTRVGEMCDDGNNIGGDGCSQDCRSTEECGNGVLDIHVGETCDDGNMTEWDGCSSDCRLTCGNGIVDEMAGEECDEGRNSENCDANCTHVSCGDGFVNPAAGEECEDRNTSNDDTCVDGCKVARCGDGYLLTDEECDDGNNVDSDECTAACKRATCEDGIHNADEGDVDCGGLCPARCDDLWSCNEETDCGGDSTCRTDTCIPRHARLAAGQSHTCAVTDSGDVRCWGSGLSGQLGYGNTNSIGDDEFPNQASGSINAGGTVTQITAGGDHTCVLLTSGKVRCWGNGASGQLGYGNTNNIGDNEIPSQNVMLSEDAIQVVAGHGHTCALLTSGNVRCWGEGFDGRLGYGNTNDMLTPGPNINLGGSVTQITAGQRHTCALLQTGSVKCWGYGTSGNLGYGSTSNIGDVPLPSPWPSVNVGDTVVQIAAGGFHTCALLASGNVRCWGSATNGKLGYGNMDRIGDDEHPYQAGPVSLGGRSVIQIVTGGAHTCALLTSGQVSCWGYGARGRLGYGNENDIGDNESPGMRMVDVGGTVVQLTAGDEHTCALLDSGAVRCWGSGFLGQLGYGNTSTIGDDSFDVLGRDVQFQ